MPNPPSQRRLPPLNAVRAFESAARHCSFTRAAEELFVTQGAVSHQVKLLEEWFGFLLFDRQQRELKLTRKGEEYLPAVRAMLNSLHVATRALLEERGKNLLCISVAESFAVCWLIKRLKRFADSHPELDIRLATQNQIDDLGNVIGEETNNYVDLRIRYGRGKWHGLQVTRLFDEQLFPACSPEFLDPERPIDQVDDLLQYTLIHDDMQMSWESWFRSAGCTEPIPINGPKFTHSHMALQAACNGSGIVLARSVLARDLIDDGKLISPLNKSVPAEHSYYLLCQERMQSEPNVQIFSHWLLEEARLFTSTEGNGH